MGTNPALVKAQLNAGLAKAKLLEEELEQVEVVVTHDELQLTFKGTGEPTKAMLFGTDSAPLLAALKEGYSRCNTLRQEAAKKIAS